MGKSGSPTGPRSSAPRANRFQNPLRQNYGHIQAVEALVPGVPVRGRVVFTDAARFPKGMPAGVCSLRDLRQDLRPLMGDEAPSPQLHQAWATLKGRAEKGPEARKAHLAALQARRGPNRRRQVAWGLLAFSALLATGLWLWPALGTAFPPKPRAPVAAQAAAPIATPAANALAWSDKNPSASDVAREACQSAIAAVLIDNSQENRKLRDRACGKEPSKPGTAR